MSEKKLKKANNLGDGPFADTLHKTMKLDKITGRHPKALLQNVPDPCESRFESLQGNMELVSKYKNTKGASIFKGLTARKELWGNPSAQPDFMPKK